MNTPSRGLHDRHLFTFVVFTNIRRPFDGKGDVSIRIEQVGRIGIDRDQNSSFPRHFERPRAGRCANLLLSEQRFGLFQGRQRLCTCCRTYLINVLLGRNNRASRKFRQPHGEGYTVMSFPSRRPQAWTESLKLPPISRTKARTIRFAALTLPTYRSRPSLSWMVLEINAKPIHLLCAANGSCHDFEGAL